MKTSINTGGEFYLADFGYFSMSVYRIDSFFAWTSTDRNCADHNICRSIDHRDTVRSSIYNVQESVGWIECYTVWTSTYRNCADHNICRSIDLRHVVIL